MTFEKFLQTGIAPFVTREVPTVENGSTLETTLASFKAAPSGSVLVVDAGTHALSGIITGSDLTKLGRSNQPQTAEDLATQEVVAVRENAQLWQLLKIMNGENALHRLLDSVPVVDEAGKPIGIVKRDRLASRLAEMERGVPA